MIKIWWSFYFYNIDEQLYVSLLREEQERLRKLEAEMRAAEEAKRREQEMLRQEEEHRRLYDD